MNDHIPESYAVTVQTNRSAPPTTLTPVLPYPDVRAAVAWLGEAFSFEERVRVGEMHRAQLRVGSDAAIVVVEARGSQQPPTGDAVPHVIKLKVEDVDAAFERARAAGAVVVMDPVTFEYGERTAEVADPAGHRWEITQTVEDVEPETWGGVTVTPW